MFREPHLGTHAGLVFYAPDNVVANRAAKAAYEKISDLDRVFSTYREDSELQRLCRHPMAANGVPVSDDLWNVLKVADKTSRESDGAFDVTVGPVARLWKRAIRRRELPKATSLKAAMQSVGYKQVVFDSAKRTIALQRPKMRIDLSGIAKGYIADEVLKVLADHGCKSALVDLGGDLAIGDAPPGKLGWRIGMETGEPVSRSAPATPTDSDNPTAKSPAAITLHNCGLATSGDAFQHVEIDGKRHSHIVDPRTGQATTESLTVTVIAPTAVKADGLASAVSVLGVEAGLQIVERASECEASILPSSQHAVADRAETDGFPRPQVTAEP